MVTKEEILKFIMEKYNPDKTSIEVELVEIWDFFGITEEDILNHSQTKPKTNNG